MAQEHIPAATPAFAVSIGTPDLAGVSAWAQMRASVAELERAAGKMFTRLSQEVDSTSSTTITLLLLVDLQLTQNSRQRSSMGMKAGWRQ